jgi:hypothetical protein
MDFARLSSDGAWHIKHDLHPKHRALIVSCSAFVDDDVRCQFQHRMYLVVKDLEDTETAEHPLLTSSSALLLQGTLNRCSQMDTVTLAIDSSP